MAVFQPSSNLRIGQVPWDNTYQHVRWYTSPEQQYNEIVAHCDSQFANNDYTYIRQNSAIRVPYNAERLYNYNYVVYKNANYGDRYFYAFITEVNYINENTTELVIETDVWQTYMFQISWKPALVERCHVGDDRIGLWRNPEPEMPLEYVAAPGRFTDPYLNDHNNMWVIVQSTTKPYNKDNIPLYDLIHTGSPMWESWVDGVIGPDSANGGWYSNIFSGGKFFAFDHNDGDNGQALKSWLDALNRCGGAEGISNIFMFPKKFIPDSERGSDLGLPENKGSYHYENETNRPETLDGYRPRNNKLWLYPYCFCRIDNNNGSEIELKYEDWQFPYTWSVQTSLDPDATVLVVPQNYQGIQNNVPAALSFQICPKCSWTYSAYQTWSAQNSLANLISGVTSFAAMATGALKGAGLAAEGIESGAKMRVKALKKGTMNKRDYVKNAARAGALNVSLEMSNADKIATVGGALGQASLMAEVNKQSKVPNTQKGLSSGNTMFGLQYMTYNVTQVTIRKEYAAILDDFLSKYGYSIEQIQQRPHPDCRRSWYFYKTIGAQHKGNMPAPELALINECCDSGITFWNTWDIANYELDNSIVQ